MPWLYPPSALHRSPCWRQVPADEELWGASVPPPPERFCPENISLPGSILATLGFIVLPLSPSPARRPCMNISLSEGLAAHYWPPGATQGPAGTSESRRPQRRDSLRSSEEVHPGPAPRRACPGPAGRGSTRTPTAGEPVPGPPPPLPLCRAAGFGAASEVPGPQPPEPSGGAQVVMVMMSPHTAGGGSLVNVRFVEL